MGCGYVAHHLLLVPRDSDEPAIEFEVASAGVNPKLLADPAWAFDDFSFNGDFFYTDARVYRSCSKKQ